VKFSIFLSLPHETKTKLKSRDDLKWGSVLHVDEWQLGSQILNFRTKMLWIYWGRFIAINHWHK